MKIREWISIIMVASLFTGLYFQYKQLVKTQNERDIYRRNTATLLRDVEYYQVLDSINVASVGSLELKISEMQRFRDEDMRLIEQLNVDRNRLQSVVTSQTETIYELHGNVRDSIIYVDNVIQDTIKCIEIFEKWFELDGCILPDAKFEGTFVSHDELFYVEHIVPKKFWFIKWGIKERRQEIASKNPHTKITGAEFISIRK